jgi:hypothetical protein
LSIELAQQNQLVYIRQFAQKLVMKQKRQSSTMSASEHALWNWI